MKTRTFDNVKVKIRVMKTWQVCAIMAPFFIAGLVIAFGIVLGNTFVIQLALPFFALFAFWIGFLFGEAPIIE